MIPTAAGLARSAHILIVDDDKHNRDLLELMLADEGFVLFTAASGEEALAVIAQVTPDLVLLDVMMPGLDGYQVTTRIKADPLTKNIPVIIVTAHDDRAAKMLGLSAGAEDFLTKPIDRAELRMRVRNLLRLRVAIAAADSARLVATHANSAKTQFLRAMSHELRTPLNAISGYTELLEMGIRGPVNVGQLSDLARIKRASSYLLRLIDDILTVARLEGVRELRPISISVNEVLAEVNGLCALQAGAKGLTFTVTPSDSEVFITADAERFQQILLNLVVNAIKFCPAGGTIAVTCECDATVARIHVRDTGVGIRALDLERVFEPFLQVDPVLTSTTTQGVGLGLSISRELARAMLGDVTVQSKEGVGSTFTLTIPRAPVTAALEPCAEAAATSPALAPSFSSGLGASVRSFSAP